jgi:CheY-like chemotaxis protein
MAKILLVDDDENIRTVAMIGLEDMPGLEIVEASSGQQALDLAQTTSPDLIVLDMMMPGMDGIQTFNQLRENDKTRDIPIIFMTAKVQSHEIESYTKLGVAGVITKPFDPLTLADEIRSFIAI